MISMFHLKQAYVCTAPWLIPCPTAEGLFLLRAEIDLPSNYQTPYSLFSVAEGCMDGELHAFRRSS